MPSTARATRRGTFAGDGLSDQRALTCPVNGARCDQVACIEWAALLRTPRSTRSGRRERHAARRGRARLLPGTRHRAAGWAQREASVGCFANPDGHAHGDRDPSCSVNVETGAWHCWGCGAKGGAFDAAIVRGLDSRRAFELKVAYGLAERDPGRPTRTTPTPVRARSAPDRRNVLLRPARWW